MRGGKIMKNKKIKGFPAWMVFNNEECILTTGDKAFVIASVIACLDSGKNGDRIIITQFTEVDNGQ
jgi:hypothetical protein